MQGSNIRAALDEAAACFNSGRLARAEEIYREVVLARPEAGLYADLAVICGRQGKHDEAVRFLKQAVELEPQSGDLRFRLGRACKNGGDTDAAARGFEEAIRLEPGHADALGELGCLDLERGDTDGAIEHLQKAIAANPGHYHAHNNLGIAERRRGRLAEAVEFHRRAIALKPDEPYAYDSLGMAYFALNQLDEAIRCHQKSIALDPKAPIPHCNLGNAYVMSLRVDDAIASHERAVALAPDRGGFRWNYANALLLAGRFERGWQEYEWRWQAPELGKKRPSYGGPSWQGEDIAGRTLLLYGEQGYGDIIQFVRYAALIERRGGKVILATEAPLARLLAGAAGVSRVVGPEARPGDIDYHCAIASLPYLFGTTLATIPASVPYLRVDQALVAAWRARTTGVEALKVGLIWGGRPALAFDHLRSCPLAALAPLSRVPGVRLYSLQKGRQAEETRSPPAGMALTDWTAELGDFADTAALMENLDLIVSVDTAGAHLAGALGRPVWLLNRHQTEWRWLLDRQDSPWYPTMRIFRQPAVGDWKSVVESVVAELTKLAAREQSTTDTHR